MVILTSVLTAALKTPFNKAAYLSGFIFLMFSMINNAAAKESDNTTITAESNAAVALVRPETPNTSARKTANNKTKQNQSNKKDPDIDPELRSLLIHAIENSDSFGDRFDAEVWLVSKSSRLERFVKDPEKRLNLLRSIHRAATEAGVQPEIVLSVIEVESRFDRFAISHAGAQGMMQVMPFWKKEIGRPDDNLFHLETNLRYGCTILKHYINKAEGRLAEALSRYNGSYGSYRYSEKVMNAWQNRWK